MFFPVLDGNIHELSILGLFGCCKDEGGVGCSILGLVFVDSLLQVRSRIRVGILNGTHSQSHLENV